MTLAEALLTTIQRSGAEAVDFYAYADLLEEEGDEVVAAAVRNCADVGAQFWHWNDVEFEVELELGKWMAHGKDLLVAFPAINHVRLTDRWPLYEEWQDGDETGHRFVLFSESAANVTPEYLSRHGLPTSVFKSMRYLCSSPGVLPCNYQSGRMCNFLEKRHALAALSAALILAVTMPLPAGWHPAGTLPPLEAIAGDQADFTPTAPVQ
jgi:hypothetical protein